MSETLISVICPSCDEHFLIGVVDTDARAALVAAQQRIVELEAALRPFGVWAEWLAESREFAAPDDLVVMRVNELAITHGDFKKARAALAGVEPAKE